jgi:hypothetical protein
MLDEGMSVKQIAERLEITPQRAGRLRKDALFDLAIQRAGEFPLLCDFEEKHWDLLKCTNHEWEKNKPALEREIAILRGKRNREREAALRKIKAQSQSRRKNEKKQAAREEIWTRAFLMQLDNIAPARIGAVFGVSERTAQEYVRRGRLVLAYRRMSQRNQGWYADKIPKADQHALAVMPEAEWKRRQWRLAACGFKNIRREEDSRHE